MNTMRNYERVKSDQLSANLYADRPPKKHRVEMQMVADAVAMLPEGEVKTILDAPCGVGRLSVWLSQKGFSITALDLGESALEMTKTALAAQNFDAPVVCQDIFNMEFGDRNFDASLCFRLLHHFSEASDREALIAELCRVSSKFVIISYISPYSVTSLRRKWRNLISATPIKQNPVSLAALKSLFSDNDFRLFATVRRSGLLHSLQLAVFKRH